MPDTVLVLAPAAAMIPPDEVYELLGHENIAIVETDDEIVQYRIAWDDVTLHVEVLTGDEQDDVLNDFQLSVDILLDERSDKKARKIWRRVERMVKVMRCTVAPDWDKARKAQLLIQGIMAYYDYAFMFADGTLYNENGNIEVGHEKSKPKYWEPIVVKVETEISNERKKRSIAILKAEKVPYIVHLPAIADAEQIEVRSKEVVTQRALALYWIAKYADGESVAWFQQKVAQYQLQEAVSDDEWTFVEDDNPPEYITIRFSQRLESCWLLLWALGFIKQLNRPDNFCNPEYTAGIIATRSPQQFLLDAALRPKDEILDAADLYYRYHWAVIDAELYGKKPPRGLKAAVVYERHYTLNWLMQYQNQDWDDVTTDT